MQKSISTKLIGRIEGEDLKRFKEGFREVAEVECWNWSKAKSGAGYGLCYINQEVVLAHRVAWALHHAKEIPEGMVIRHSCDNPACVNPAHLVVGSQRDNIRDAIQRGRWSAPPIFHGERHPMAKLTDAERAFIASSSEPIEDIVSRFGITRNYGLALRRRAGRGCGHVRNKQGQMVSVEDRI